MTAFKTLISLLTFSALTICAAGQSLALFDTKLYVKTTTLCDLLNKYVDKRQEFKFTSFDTSFCSVSSYDNHSAIYGYWIYVVRNDTLCQLEFSSLAFPINAGWFDKPSKFADNAVYIFTAKYGKPSKDTVVKDG